MWYLLAFLALTLSTFINSNYHVFQIHTCFLVNFPISVHRVEILCLACTLIFHVQLSADRFALDNSPVILFLYQDKSCTLNCSSFYIVWCTWQPSSYLLLLYPFSTFLISFLLFIIGLLTMNFFGGVIVGWGLWFR